MSTDIEIINIRRISGGSFYKLLFIGSLGSYFLLGLIVLIFSLFGFPIQSGGEDLEQGKSILASLGIMGFGLLAAPLFAVILWVSLWPAIWLYSKIRPMKIGYINASSKDS